MENEILEKLPPYSQETIEKIVAFIEKYKSKYTVKLIAKS